MLATRPITFAIFAATLLVALQPNVCFAAPPPENSSMQRQLNPRGVGDKTPLTGERYIRYLQKAVEQATRFASGRRNDAGLWAEVRNATENLLINEWRSGRLQGATRFEAFFVHCDVSTMTAADIGSGILIVWVGVAPIKPAEFAVFSVRRQVLVP